MKRLALWTALAVALAGLAPAEAARLCGSVFSSGVPVKGVHVIAMERGALATSDATGAFCLDDLDSGTVTLRALAVGYQPGERLVTLGSGAGEVRIELVPLRSASGGWSAGSSTQEARPDTPVPPPPPPSVEPKKVAFLAEVPLLVLPADSAWLAGKHRGGNWDSLFVLHDELMSRRGGDTALDPATWRALEDRIKDLYIPQCADERPHRRGIGPNPCAYLERALATVQTRAAVLSGKDLSRNTRIYLQRMSGSSNPRVKEWAAKLLGKASGPESAKK